jgi:hypothetical protein
MYIILFTFDKINILFYQLYYFAKQQMIYNIEYSSCYIEKIALQYTTRELELLCLIILNKKCLCFYIFIFIENVSLILNNNT